jgi:hypothetical protein
MDLDDMLNDVDIDNLKSKNKEMSLDDMLDDAADSVLVKNKQNKNDPEIEQEQKIRIVSDQIKPWLAFTANVPAELREKWTKMAKIDSETEVISKFHPSTAYRSWDPVASSKLGINKGLQDLVKKSANKCGIDEARTVKILAMLNPVTDSEHGKQLQTAFARQLVADLKDDIKSDPNYSATRFPELSNALVSN